LKPGESQPVTLTRVASEGYFEAMGIRLKFGRFFDANDGREGGERVVIVNEMFVRTFWPGTTDAVGKRISFNNPKEPWMTVVGVARDIKHYGLELPMRPGLYFPAKQLASNLSAPSVVVRTTGDPAAFESTARTILREMDPTVPLYRAQTAETMLRNSMRTRATYSWMLAVFAGLALVLALGGAYGVTSYLVTQRIREIGIRLAMGAQSGDIVGGVLRSSLVMIGSGVVMGLVASMFVATQVGDLLLGVSPRDPSVLAATAVILALAAVVANWIPARRAARTDPMISLRE
jgi:putative ABC transport system permease protein